MDMVNIPGHINSHQAAQKIGVSHRTIYRWIQSGALPAKRYGREWVIKESDLEKGVTLDDSNASNTD